MVNVTKKSFNSVSKYMEGKDSRRVYTDFEAPVMAIQEMHLLWPYSVIKAIGPWCEVAESWHKIPVSSDFLFFVLPCFTRAWSLNGAIKRNKHFSSTLSSLDAVRIKNMACIVCVVHLKFYWFGMYFDCLSWLVPSRLLWETGWTRGGWWEGRKSGETTGDESDPCHDCRHDWAEKRRKTQSTKYRHFLYKQEDVQKFSRSPWILSAFGKIKDLTVTLA